MPNRTIVTPTIQIHTGFESDGGRPTETSQINVHERHKLALVGVLATHQMVV